MRRRIAVVGLLVMSVAIGACRSDPPPPPPPVTTLEGATGDIWHRVTESEVELKVLPEGPFPRGYTLRMGDHTFTGGVETNARPSRICGPFCSSYLPSYAAYRCTIPLAPGEEPAELYLVELVDPSGAVVDTLEVTPEPDDPPDDETQANPANQANADETTNATNYHNAAAQDNGDGNTPANDTNGTPNDADPGDPQDD